VANASLNAPPVGGVVVVVVGRVVVVEVPVVVVVGRVVDVVLVVVVAPPPPLGYDTLSNSPIIDGSVFTGLLYFMEAWLWTPRMNQPVAGTVTL
jgi:hypothetical protein